MLVLLPIGAEPLPGGRNKGDFNAQPRVMELSSVYPQRALQWQTSTQSSK